MKKQKRILLALAAVLLILAAVIAAILLMYNKNEPEPDISGGILVEKDPAQITSVSVTNTAGSFTVSRKDGAVHLEHYSDVPLDDAAVEELFHYAASLRVRQKVSGKEPLSEYGLETPYSSVAVSLDDGSTYDFSLGSEVPGQDTAPVCYLLYENAVYTTFRLYAEPFFIPEESFIDHRVTPVSKDASDATVTPETMLTLQKADVRPEGGLPYSVSFAGSEDVLGNTLRQYELRMGDAVYPYTTDGIGTNYLSSFFSLAADAIVSAHPSPEETAACRLDAPAVTAEVSYTSAAGEEGTFSLAVSPAGDGGSYVYRPETDLIYHIPDVPLFCVTDSQQLVSTYLLIPQLSSLTAVTLEADGAADRFEIDSEAEQVQLGTRSIPLSEFRTFYTSLIQMKADTVCFTPYSTEGLSEAGKITYEATDHTTQSIELYELTPRKLLAVTGGTQYELPASVWEEIKKQIP